MTESIDELYSRWQRNPDAAQTAMLCEALRTSRRPDLVEIVGSHASRQLDVETLIAAARMYTDASRLDDAQQVLIAAGRLAPRDGDVYRWLGEVLVRRGDAERAEKVLERAIQFGAKGDDAGRWLNRARSLLAMQLAQGMAAVAQEVATHGVGGGPGNAALPPPTVPPRRKTDSEPDDIETLVRKNDEVKAALAAGRPPAPIPAAGRPAVDPPLPSFEDVLPKSSPSIDFGVHQPQTAALPFGAPAAQGVAADAFARGAATGEPALPPSSDRMPAAPVSAGAPAVSERPERPLPPPEPPINPFLAPPAVPKPVGPGGQPIPEARDVLEALQIAGVFEADGAVKPGAMTWDKPEKGKRRIGSFATLITLAVLLVGGGTGTFYYVKDLRAKQHLQAEELLTSIDMNLAASEASRLEPAEKDLAKAFDLESRSPHAALTWLHERAMVGLLKGGADVAFEDGTQRAKEVGVPEKQIAFAYVASFLFQGDTAGAASAVAKWDGKADDDAWYQLVAGATFERAGDTRALDRYTAAVKLAPNLVIAQILLARATAIDGDPHRAGELAKDMRAKHPNRLEGQALTSLAWARDPMRGDPPAEAKEIADKADALPVPLKVVPHATRALLAIDQHKNDEAKAALTKGLGVADTPGGAAWLGSIALATGDEGLARKGALAAVSFSAVYPPARMLAARVALLGARLDEALKASEELAPTSPDVAIVTSAVAYEKLDGERMSRALDALPEDARKLPFLVPLVRGQQLLAGKTTELAPDKALDMADDEAPWADLVAMDAALDTGDLELAKKIAAQWQGDARPLRALRLARLARYEGKNEDADRLSKGALEGGTVTPRALAERVFVLTAIGKSTEAIALFKQYPNAGGPLAKWLRAYATAAHGKMEEARAIVSQEDPPPALAPLPARVIAAAAYGAIKDARHGNEYVKAIAQAGFVNPDVAAAAEKVGVGKIAPRTAKPSGR
ncbi:MAG: hypothetical protein JST00_09295 [Deltaproteobacteria bacterium]|nr:hypothetical protein [Deltaproteobacteria bacterium]